MPHDGQIGIYFDSSGHRLLGTLFLAADDTPKPTAIILHGIPGIEKNYDLALALRGHGWNAVIFHYRGCWGSGGDYNIPTIPDDVQAALDYLGSGAHPQVDPSRIVLIGHSLGGWAAVITAARDPRVQAVVNIAGVNNLSAFDFSLEMAASDFAPWLPNSTPEGLVTQWQSLTAEYDPLIMVSDLLSRPLLVVAGADDTILPPGSHAEPLYQLAEEPKKYHLHPEANHGFTLHRPWLINHILEWLTDLGFSNPPED